MTWYLYSQGRRVPLAAGVEYTVGRAADSDVVIDGSRVSRTHLILSVAADNARWTLVDKSANGSFTVDGPLRSRRSGTQAAVALGAADGPTLVVSHRADLQTAEISAMAREIAAATATDQPASASGPLPVGSRVRLGRDPDNDIVIPGLLASAHHAQIISGPDGWELLDLNSARGTYVQGERVKYAILHPGDEISLGGSTFTYTSQGLVPRSAEGGVPVEAAGITVQIGGNTLLHDIRFRAEPRTVTAVIGPSGSGKSTLLNAMTGLRPAESGQVLIDGADFYSRYEEMRFRVGAVPQADLVPAQLKVREALDFAARLRFPNETPKAARDARVAEVTEELGLTARADLRIDRLSGGQRKRVSVALELLTKPEILYLDEPTSGLDPGLDRQVMMLLRELADAGRTVFVVTHAVENLGLADRLIVLAAGGWLAYDGPPSDALKYFNAPDMPTVFTTLESTPGEAWAKRWSAKATTRDSTTPGHSTIPAPATTAKFAKPVGSLSQLPTLMARNIKVIMADKGYVGFLVLLPVILGIAGALVGSSAGLGKGDPPTYFNPDARSILLVIVLGCTFTGTATSIQELVKERVIYQRERAVGLSRGAYISSKALVLGSIAAVQGFVFALLTLFGRSGPADPLILPADLEIAIVAAVATVCAAMMGLALSALLPSRDMAMPVLVVVTILEIILSGAIPLRVDWVVDYVGWVIAGNWQFTAMAASAGLHALLGPAGGGDEWPHTLGTYLTGLGVLGAMSVIFLVLAVVLTGRHDPGRR